MEQGDDWRSPAGKQPMNYGNVMQKKNIEKDAAIAEAKFSDGKSMRNSSRLKHARQGVLSHRLPLTTRKRSLKREKGKEELTEEEKAEKKRLAAEKRKANALKKKAEKEAAAKAEERGNDGTS